MDANLYALFARAFPADRTQVALATPAGTAFDYAALDTGSARLAGLLATLGLQPGDRVSVQVRKSPQAVLLYLACLRGGYVFHPLNDGYRRDELAWLVADADPALAVCDPDAADLFTGLVPARCRVLTLAADGTGSLTTAAATTTTDLPATVSRRESDLAALLYTSGTTGRAKGAMLSHGNLVANVLQVVSWFGGRAKRGEEVVITALPLYHIYALTTNCFSFLSQGGLNYLITDPRDLQGFVRELKRVPFTTLTGVNTLFNALINHPGV